MKLVGWRSALAVGAALAAAISACANGTGSAQGMGGTATSSSAGPTGGTGGKGAGGQGGCASATDCPVPANACVLATCTAGACGTANAPQGTVAMADVPADCHGMICDGMGHAMPGIDPSDTPQSSDPCLVGTCDLMGMPGTAPAPAGVACTSSSGGHRCDGMGNCVECLDAADCPSGQTCDVLNTCMGSHCTDGVQDDGETDVDCGGDTCPACATGQMCMQGSDCMSSACDGLTHTCLSPKCSDGMKDLNETDVDCGGACLPCATGKECLADQDCLSKACDALTLVCVASQCSDQQKDGQETDVDCGGPCPPCALGKMCLSNTDCASGTCDASHTCAGNACSNGVKDGQETDVDCGGGTCPTCALGKMCVLASDCTSNACDAISLTCVADPCSDHQQDGNETDVDCGGGTCPGCAVGQHCITMSDCAAPHTCETFNPHECH